jgi:hypothetical protein
MLDNILSHPHPIHMTEQLESSRNNNLPYFHNFKLYFIDLIFEAKTPTFCVHIDFFFNTARFQKLTFDKCSLSMEKIR